MFITLLALHTQLPDKFGITPLLAAIYESHAECVKLLISNVSQFIVHVQPSFLFFTLSLFPPSLLPSLSLPPSLPLPPSLSSLRVQIKMSKLQTDHPTKIVQRVTKSRIFSSNCVNCYLSHPDRLTPCR